MHGAVYEIDPGYASRESSLGTQPAAPSSCGCAASVAPVGAGIHAGQSLVGPTIADYAGSSAAFRGTYMLDAYTGEILVLPAELR